MVIALFFVFLFTYFSIFWILSHLLNLLFLFACGLYNCFCYVHSLFCPHCFSVLLNHSSSIPFYHRDCDDEDTGGSETITNYFNGTFLHSYVHTYIRTYVHSKHILIIIQYSKRCFYFFFINFLFLVWRKDYFHCSPQKWFYSLSYLSLLLSLIYFFSLNFYFITYYHLLQYSIRCKTTKAISFLHTEENETCLTLRSGMNLMIEFMDKWIRS